MIKINKYNEREITQEFEGFELEFNELNLIDGVEISVNVQTFTGGRDITTHF